MSSTEVFVYTSTRIGKVGAWSRYLFPWRIDAHTQLGNLVYLRAGDDIHVLEDDGRCVDNIVDTAGRVTLQPFNGVIWWPWLDLGSPGRSKMLQGFDVTGKGSCRIEFGWNQDDPRAFTAPLTLVPDTVPGKTIPMMLNAPSYSVRIEYPGNQNWEFLGLQLYLQDQRFQR